MALCRLGESEKEESRGELSGVLDNIEAKTGKSPDQLREWGKYKGFSTGTGLAPGVKAGTIVAALKEEFGLGHGHAMAVVALLKGAKQDGRRP